MDAIDARPYREETFAGFIKANDLPDKPIIALLAGSRSQELRYVLPAMLRMVDHFPDYQFVIAGAEGTGGPYFVWADLSFVESGESGSGYLGYGDPGNGFTAYSPSGLLQWRRR